MRQKGFTLIELIGTIVLISMLVLIITPTANRVIKIGKIRADQQQTSSIELAARNWGADHRNELPEKDTIKDIAVSQLQEEGYLDKGIKMPSTSELISGCVRIENISTYEKTKQVYEYTFKDKIDECIVNFDSNLVVNISAKEIINGIEQTNEYNNTWTKNPIRLIASAKSNGQDIKASRYTWRKATSNEEISTTTSNSKVVQLAKEEGTIPYYVSIDGSGYYGPKNLKIDTKAPTITDNGSGIAGYQLTSNKVKPTNWISINNSPQTYTNEITKTPGVYYIWVKDTIGNISAAMKATFKEHVPNRIIQVRNNTDAFWEATYSEKIVSIKFENHTNVPNGATSWDVSADKDRGVMAWIVKDTSDSTKYVLHIGGKGGVIANKNSSNLFYNFKNVKSITFGSNFDTSSVTNMIDMFYGCSGLTSLDLSKFNTSEVTSMSGMFWNCKSLTSLNISNFNTSRVTNMARMFENCENLKSLDVSKFDTSKVTTMSNMFDGCSNLTSLDVSKFDTSKVTTMLSMFYGCSSLTSLDVSKFDTSKVTSMKSMFAGCKNLTSLNVSNFDTSKVTAMDWMFYHCSGLTSLNVSKWDTSNVTNMSYTFDSCANLKTLDVSKWKTDKVTTMASTFYGCSSLTSLNVSNFNTSNVTDMHLMFYGCSSLTSLDVSKFDTSKVTSMESMFAGCRNLTSLNVSNFDTSKVTAMDWMFATCQKISSLNLTKFNTSKVTDMSAMFMGCTNIKTLDLSNFDTSNVTAMGGSGTNLGMFGHCTNLTTIYVSNKFVVSKVTNSDNMFLNDEKLVGGNGTKYNSSKIDKTYARIDKSGQPGYFTKK